MADDSVLVDETMARRVRALTFRIGTDAAIEKLHVSTTTYAAARGLGRMKRSTRDRINAALDLLEAEPVSA